MPCGSVHSHDKPLRGIELRQVAAGGIPPGRLALAPLAGSGLINLRRLVILKD
jgi:hypothetical protein